MDEGNTYTAMSLIIVPEHGQIIKEGTNTELLARNGRYVHRLQLAVDGVSTSGCVAKDSNDGINSVKCL